MNMVYKSIHIFDIHLAIRIKSHKSFHLEFVSIHLNKIVSGLICSSSSSIDRMRQDNNKRIKVLLLFLFKNFQGMITRTIIDKNNFSESCGDDFINNTPHSQFFVICSDIKNKFIFFISITSLVNTRFISIISLFDSSLRDKSRKLESISGLFIEQANIKVAQQNQSNIHKQISSSCYPKKATKRIK